MKNIAITGAAGGLGRALTRQYLDMGWTIWAYDVKGNAHTDAFLAEAPGHYHFAPLDITDGAAVAGAAEALEREIHGLDVLVNAAGILTKNGEKQLEDFDIEDALRVFPAGVRYQRSGAAARDESHAAADQAGRREGAGEHLIGDRQYADQQQLHAAL